MENGDPVPYRSRRDLVRTAAASVAASSLATGLATSQEAEGAIAFEEQASDGDSVVVASVSSGVDARVIITEDRAGKREEQFFGQRSIAAGTETSDLTVELRTPIEETKTIKALLIGENDEFIARDTAIVVVGDEAGAVDDYGVTLVEADPASGFEYPYYLFTPPGGGEEVPLLVEPNNTGTATDDFEKHRQGAREFVEGGLTRRLSKKLSVPLLVPVFPRPQSDPVDATHYVHQLDVDTLMISDGPLERVDLQLLRMVEDAKERLSDTAYSFSDQIIMNGFSASGNFVDRFTVLHPDRVLSVTAGGLNGMTVLPLGEAKGHTLPYHIGIADVEKITGEPVDLAALDEVNQLLYMGSEDQNDTIPYDDAWTSDEMRETALAVYGEEMIRDRFPFCQRAYDRADVEAQFRIYDGAGHTPRPAVEDIVEFHRRSIEGESVSEFGQRLGTVARIEVTPSAPGTDETVEFDAAMSRANGGSELIAYTWDFGDGSTAAGESVTHAFDRTGEYTVTLEVVSDTGATATSSVDIAVGDASGNGDDNSTASAPGFGVGAALAGIGGATYRLTSREGTDE